MGINNGQVTGTTKIVDHGPASDRFNFVILAEGFRQDELSLFETYTNQLINFLFSSPPFNDLKCAFNIYRINVASDETGADDPAACGGPGTTAATYFDASFCNSGIRRLLVINSQTAINLLNSEVPEWHQALVIVNSSEWGGSGGQIGVTSVATGWETIALHEMGHSAFGLVDEYPYWSGCGIDTTRDMYPGTEPGVPNATTDSNRDTIKWGDLILASTPMPTTSNPDCSQCDSQANPQPPGTVGAFEGGCYYHCGIYRPAYSCMMNDLQDFCGVCQERIRSTLVPYLEECYAPQFKPQNWFICILLTIIFAIIIIILTLPALFSGSIRCYIKGLIFRIRNCCKGNTKRCIQLK